MEFLSMFFNTQIPLSLQCPSVCVTIWQYVWNILKILLNLTPPHKILWSIYCILRMKIPNNAYEAVIFLGFSQKW